MALAKTTDIKAYFSQDNIKAKFAELLGKRAPQFITSVLQICANNKDLAEAEPSSIFNSAAMAATLDLAINANLGFAYIIAYNQKQADGTWKKVAQFQMGYKGFIQLAQRSGQFQTIAATPIYEGQLIEQNPLLGFRFDFTKKTSDKIIGYASYFRLLNGFEKTLYVSSEDMKKHGLKFSQTFKKGFGLWKDDFDSMAIKTVIKTLLSKYAPLSIEMQKAVIVDQSIINDVEALDVSYDDNAPYSEEVVTVEMLKELLDEKYELITAQEIIDVRAVIDGKKEKDYKRAYALLNNAKPKG